MGKFLQDNFPWIWMSGFLALYAGAYFVGGWLGTRANRKNGPLR